MIWVGAFYALKKDYDDFYLCYHLSWFFRHYLELNLLRKMASSSGNEGVEGSSEEEKPKFQNRLALERSPYLLQHASNPVDW